MRLFQFTLLSFSILPIILKERKKERKKKIQVVHRFEQMAAIALVTKTKRWSMEAQGKQLEKQSERSVKATIGKKSVFLEREKEEISKAVRKTIREEQLIFQGRKEKKKIKQCKCKSPLGSFDSAHHEILKVSKIWIHGQRLTSGISFFCAPLENQFYKLEG